MNNLVFTVSGNYKYLPANFDDELWKLIPGQKKMILSKGICGCGATESVLRNDKAVVLVSPRTELLYNKSIKDDRPWPVYYVDKSKDTKTSRRSMNELDNYLCWCYSNKSVPKILVTYDSFKDVIGALKARNIEEDFGIVVDEFSCMFSDAKYKGYVELRLMEDIKRLPNYSMFISATPISETILEKVDCFKDIPYIRLLWDKSHKRKVDVVHYTMTSAHQAITEIIDSYYASSVTPADRYFDVTKVKGMDYYSREAVFFINDVNTICKIINEYDEITPDNTTVICGLSPKNIQRLRKVGFEIGHVPSEGSPNPTFMFVTRRSFEGSDFYSDNSSTYVFANPNSKNLSIDITLDLPQIAGRCRTEYNPFRDTIKLYYKSSYKRSIEEAEKNIEDKYNRTLSLVNKYKDIHDPEMLEVYNDMQKREGLEYSKNYCNSVFDASTRKAQLVCNDFVYWSERMDLEAKKEQYKNHHTVYTYIQGINYNPIVGDIEDEDNRTIRKLLIRFNGTTDFAMRMKLYVSFLQAYPHLKMSVESRPFIPKIIKDFYNSLGAELIQQKRYRYVELQKLMPLVLSESNVKRKISQVVGIGQRYTRDWIKKQFQRIYDELGIKKNATATLIQDFYETKDVLIPNSQGKRDKGFEIIGEKM